MADPIVTVTDAPDAQAHEAIQDGLRRFNAEQSGIDEGLGGRMLGLAEDEARRRGCRAAVLYTISFQAPGFYERYGYRIFGAIDSDPPGTSRIFMTKALG